MNAETQIPHFQYPQLQRERDISLMEAFQTKYTGKKILAQLNRCRVLLQVITLSDITDASGMKLCPFIISGRIHPQRKSVYTWRNQSEMHSKAWRTWKACIKNTFTYDGTHLRKPLGDWLHTVSSQHWAAYKTEDDCLFIVPDENNPTWVKIPPLSRNLHSLQYDIYNSTGASCNPPQKAYKVSLSSASPRTLI